MADTAHDWKVAEMLHITGIFCSDRVFAFPPRQPVCIPSRVSLMRLSPERKQQPESCNEQSLGDDEGANGEAPPVEGEELNDVFKHDFGRQFAGADLALGETEGHFCDACVGLRVGLEQELQCNLEA